MPAQQQSLTRQILAGQTQPPDLLAFADQSPIGGLTIVNNSPVTIGVFVGSQAPQGNADFQIPPFSSQGTPIAGASYLSLQYSGPASASGYVYINLSGDPVIAFTSQIQPPSATQFAAGGSGVGAMTGGSIGDAQAISSFTIAQTAGAGKMTLGQKLYVSQILVSGVDFQRLLYAVEVFDRTNFGTTTILTARGDVNYAPTQNNAAYVPGALGEQIGDTVELQISILENYQEPLNLVYTVNAYIQ